MKRKIVILSIILLSIIFILLVLFSIKFYKVNKIINLIRVNSNKTNYSYFIKNSFEENSELYIKRNKNIIISKVKLSTQNVKEYYNFKIKTVYGFSDIIHKYYERPLNDYDNEFIEFPLYNFLTSDFSFGNKLKLVFEWKIRNYDENCYEITTKDNYKIIFDKTTGIALRATSLDVNEKFDRIVEDFKENSVTDEETKLPDLSDYSLWENN